MSHSTTRRSFDDLYRDLMSDRPASPPPGSTLLSRAYRVTVTKVVTYLVDVPAVSDVLVAVPEDEAESWAEDHYETFGTWDDEDVQDIDIARVESEDEYEDADEPEDADEIRALMLTRGMHYPPGETLPPPPPLSGGRVLVHNFPPLVDGEIVPDQRQGVNGFRFWLQDGTAPEAPPLVACGCGWAPGHAVHYQPEGGDQA